MNELDLLIIYFNKYQYTVYSYIPYSATLNSFLGFKSMLRMNKLDMNGDNGLLIAISLEITIKLKAIVFHISTIY